MRLISSARAFEPLPILTTVFEIYYGTRVKAGPHHQHQDPHDLGKGGRWWLGFSIGELEPWTRMVLKLIRVEKRLEILHQYFDPTHNTYLF